MAIFDEHGRRMAIILWLFCVAGIIADFFCQYDELQYFKITKAPVSLIFLTMSCGAPLYRVFGANIVVQIFHFVLSFLPYVFIFTLHKELSWMALGILLFFGIIQSVSAFILLWVRPGHTAGAYAFRVGVHALFGIITIVVYYLICCFLLKPDINHGSAVVEAFYMLLLLMILVTPGFQAPNQAIPQAKQERKHIIEKLNKLEGKRRISRLKDAKSRSAGSSPRNSTAANEGAKTSALKK